MMVCVLAQVEGQIAGRLLNAMSAPARKGALSFAGSSPPFTALFLFCAQEQSECCPPDQRSRALDIECGDAADRPVRLPWSQPEDARFVCDVMAGAHAKFGRTKLQKQSHPSQIASNIVQRRMVHDAGPPPTELHFFSSAVAAVAWPCCSLQVSLDKGLIHMSICCPFGICRGSSAAAAAVRPGCSIDARGPSHGAAPPHLQVRNNTSC